MRNKLTWNTVKLGDIASVISGFAFKSKDFKNHGIPIIKIKNIRIGSVDFSEVDYVENKFLYIPQKYHLKKNGLLNFASLIINKLKWLSQN